MCSQMEPGLHPVATGQPQPRVLPLLAICRFNAICSLQNLANSVIERCQIHLLSLHAQEDAVIGVLCVVQHHVAFVPHLQCDPGSQGSFT